MRKAAFWLVTLLCLSLSSALAQGAVRGVVVSEVANVRIVPALGADVVANVPGGWDFVATGRSPDNEWLRIDFNGDEGWLHISTLVILEGDINALTVADPRTIPYGGFESPRAGMSNATSAITGKLTDWMNLRAGPGTGYPVLANPPYKSVLYLTGRTASSGWIQVVFEGTLGWLSARYVQPLNGAVFSNLPIDGIVADSLPLSQPTTDDYIATLRLLLDRVNLAQPSLDTIRAAWADASLAGRAFCHSYPARPSDYNIPNPLLAAYYPTLDPIHTLFNDAMYNVRYAIDLFIEVCNQPGTGNPVGQGTVQGALGVVNLADGQFAELRRQITALLPPDREIGPNECLLSYGGETDVLPLVQIDTIYTATFDPKKDVVGFCFDVQAGTSLNFEVLQTEGNATPYISVSPLDNPTNFIAVGSDPMGGSSVRVGPVVISTAGRYLLIVSQSVNISVTEALTANFAYAVINTTGLTVAPQLGIDPETGQVIFITPDYYTGDQVTVTEEPLGSVACPSLAFNCSQLFTCEEAQACLLAGKFELDPDGDGIPCEETLCTGG
jgi:uncharacterized protein YraI